MEDVRYMISEASKRVGVESHTLRYWEEELALPIDRNELGHRYYKDTDIELLKTIKKLKEQGFQLKAIKLLLPNLQQLKSLDNNEMIKLREEMNGKVDEMRIDDNTSGKVNGNIDDNADDNNINDDVNISDGLNENVVDDIKSDIKDEADIEENINDDANDSTAGDSTDDSMTGTDKDNETSLMANHNKEIEPEAKDKMSQFRAIMNQIISSALKENNAELSEEISATVTDNVIKEMHFLMRLLEEREEERYRKFDATLREYQRSRLHTAAVLEGRGRKKSKFFKKHKVYI